MNKKDAKRFENLEKQLGAVVKDLSRIRPSLGRLWRCEKCKREYYMGLRKPGKTIKRRGVQPGTVMVDAGYGRPTREEMKKWTYEVEICEACLKKVEADCAEWNAPKGGKK